MKNRRKFIKRSLLGFTALGLTPTKLFSDTNKTKQLTILHTNDTHSHIEPFNSGKYKGMGGMISKSNYYKKN